MSRPCQWRRSLRPVPAERVPGCTDRKEAGGGASERADGCARRTPMLGLFLVSENNWQSRPREAAARRCQTVKMRRRGVCSFLPCTPGMHGRRLIGKVRCSGTSRSGTTVGIDGLVMGRWVLHVKKGAGEWNPTTLFPPDAVSRELLPESLPSGFHTGWDGVRMPASKPEMVEDEPLGVVRPAFCRLTR